MVVKNVAIEKGNELAITGRWRMVTCLHGCLDETEWQVVICRIERKRLELKKYCHSITMQ